MTLTGIRAVALIGILPGAIVAAAYLSVLTVQLVHHWDPRILAVLAMAVWGVLGVVELWHEYVRRHGHPADAEGGPVSPRVVLFVWGLLLVAVAGWRMDDHPYVAAFLGFVALYSFARAFGLFKYAQASVGVARRVRVVRSSSSHPAGSRDAKRSRAKDSRDPRADSRAEGRAVRAAAAKRSRSSATASAGR